MFSLRFLLDENESFLRNSTNISLVTRLNLTDEKAFNSFQVGHANNHLSSLDDHFHSNLSTYANFRSDKQIAKSILIRSSIQILLVVILGISFNQPNFCPNASWNRNATTLIPNKTIGLQSLALFVNTHNTLFIAHRQNGQIFIWRNGSVNPNRTILANLSSPSSLFVTDDEEIFVDNGNLNNRVDKWTSNGTQLPPPMSICSQCFGLFIDSNDHLYCSQYQAHQVVRRSLQDLSSPMVIVAGTGCQGSTATTLYRPWGIFVTETFDLYVTDCDNDRIQMFRSGESNGTTVPINGSNGITIVLTRPSAVMLDGDGYLFILDTFHHRVLRSGPWGFRCVAGCSGFGGSASNRLLYPRAMSFDRDGNLLVLDGDNGRVQKFFLATNSCSCKWNDFVLEKIFLIEWFERRGEKILPFNDAIGI